MLILEPNIPHQCNALERGRSPTMQPYEKQAQIQKFIM